MPWWVIVAVAGVLALGAWAPLVPGLQLRRRAWIFWGVLWTAVAIAGWALAGGPDDQDSVAGLLVIVAWVGAAATALIIRPRYLELAGSGWTKARREAEERLREREEAVRMATEQPDLAVEVGVGRPDRPGAQHGGVVDVNNAPASVLRGLPGIDDALATRIVEVRAQIDGFSSVDDLGGVLDLDGRAVERLRPLVVCLPR